jgi:hypothetical protein
MSYVKSFECLWYIMLIKVDGYNCIDNISFPMKRTENNIYDIILTIKQLLFVSIVTNH